MLPAYYRLDLPQCGSHREQFASLRLKTIVKGVVFVHERTFLKCTTLEEQIQLLTAAHRETKKIPVICLDSNPFENLNQLAATLENSTSIPFFILGCDSCPGAYHHPNVDLWPFWLLQQQTEKNYQSRVNPQYRISFLSGVPKNHRLKLFDKIRRCITDQDIVIINRLSFDTVMNPDLVSILNILPWTNHKHLLDIPLGDTFIKDFSSNCHPAYSACVNITAESVSYRLENNHNYDSLHFITEKTWKAYRSGCLVINYGIDSLPSTLAHYGFRIWNDYDICGSIDQKIQHIVELFQRSDVFNMYQAHSADIAFNQQLVNSRQLVEKMTTPTVDKIGKIIN
jgi:hypothetical protein